MAWTEDTRVTEPFERLRSESLANDGFLYYDRLAV